MTQPTEANRKWIENEHLRIKTLFQLTLMKGLLCLGLFEKWSTLDQKVFYYVLSKIGVFGFLTSWICRKKNKEKRMEERKDLNFCL